MFDFSDKCIYFLQVIRPVFLHEGQQDFSIHSWDSQGSKRTLTVRVLHHVDKHFNHHQNVELQHGQNKHHQYHLTEEDVANNDVVRLETLLRRL